MGKKDDHRAITDTHVLPEGRKLGDLIDSNGQLEAAASGLNGLSTPADVVLVTGDLADGDCVPSSAATRRCG